MKRGPCSVWIWMIGWEEPDDVSTVGVGVFAVAEGECPGNDDSCVVSTAAGVLGGELIARNGDDRPDPGESCGDPVAEAGVFMEILSGLSRGFGRGVGAGWTSISSISLRGVLSSCDFSAACRGRKHSRAAKQLCRANRSTSLSGS